MMELDHKASGVSYWVAHLFSVIVIFAAVSEAKKQKADRKRNSDATVNRAYGRGPLTFERTEFCRCCEPEKTTTCVFEGKLHPGYRIIERNHNGPY